MVFCYNKADLNLKHTMIEGDKDRHKRDIYNHFFCKRLLNFD